MTPVPVVHDTFTLTRSFAKAPQRVFEALGNPDQRRRWLGSKTVESFDSDFRSGGLESMQMRMGEDTPFPGAPLTTSGQFLDIVPGVRIVMSNTMALDGRRFSASLVTYELRATENGTELVLTHQGAFFEGSDGPERRRHGWEALMEALSAHLAS